jgi:hypothetical protein
MKKETKSEVTKVTMTKEELKHALFEAGAEVCMKVIKSFGAEPITLLAPAIVADITKLTLDQIFASDDEEKEEN